MPDIVGRFEIAQRLGVKPDTVGQWIARGVLPEPEARLAAGPVWLWSSIERWAVATGRLTR